LIKKIKAILYNLTNSFKKNENLELLKDSRITLFGLNNVINYPIDHKQINSTKLIKFLSKLNIEPDDLIVCDIENFKDLYKLYNKNVVKISKVDEVDPTKFKRLIWLSTTPELGNTLSLHFFENRKKVFPYNSFGPTRITSYGNQIYSTLLDEHNLQSSEGIEKFSYGTGYDQAYILQLINNTINLDGDFVEIGCYQGSTSCVLVQYLNRLGVSKKLYFLDTFEGFNYEEAKKSVDSQWYGTHAEEDKNTIEKRIKSRAPENKNIKVIKSNIIEKDSLNFLESISLASIDVDMYEAVYHALLKVDKKLVQHGVIICEDYGHLPALIGANAAVDKFLNETVTEYFKLYLNSGQLLLIKMN